MKIGNCQTCGEEIKYKKPKILVTIIDKNDGKSFFFCSNNKCLPDWVKINLEKFIKIQNIDSKPIKLEK